MIEVCNVSAIAAVSNDSRKSRRARGLGLSVAAAMLAGTALVPAMAQTYNINVDNGGPLVVANFVDAPLLIPTEITNGQLTVSNGVSVSFGGLLTDSGGVFNLIKSGVGALTLSGANTYSGGTTLQAGSLLLGNNLALGSNPVIVTGASALGSVGVNRILGNSISIDSGITLSVSSASGQFLTLNGVISGDGILRKTGSNATVRLNGVNTYTGGTTLSGGRVEIGSGSVVMGSTSAFGTGNISTGSPNITTIALATPASSITLANNIALTSTALRVEAPGASQIITLSGNITGTRAFTVTGVSTGTVLLTGANTATGDFGVNGGWLGLGSTAALSGSNAVVIGSAAQGLAFYGADVVVSRTLTDSVVGAELNAAAVASIDTRGFNGTLSGALRDANTGAGDTLGLIKAGAGILTVSNAAADVGTRNILTGGFAVDEGTLNLTGALHNAVTVNSGGTLAGTGAVTDGTATIGSGGTLAPGNALVADSVGTLAFTNLTLAAGSSATFNLGAPGVSDLVVVSGALSLDGTLNLAGVPGFTVGNYQLFNFGSLAGTLTINAVPNNDFAYMLSQVGNSLNLNVALLDYYWDGIDTAGNNMVDGGPGIFTQAATNWTNATGTLQVAFGENAANRANFGGNAGGTVTLVDAFVFSQLNFLIDGYVLVDGGGALDSLAPQISVADGATATINAGISGDVLTKIGGGTLNLGVENFYTGGTLLNAGRINIGANGALGDVAGGVTMAAGTTLGAYAGQATVANAFTIAGGVTFDAGTLLRLDGAIGGTGGFTKTGAEDLSLGAANNFTGNVNVNAGSITLYDSTSLGDAGNVLNLAGGTALGLGAGVNISNAIAVAGAVGVSQPMGGTATLSGVISGSGPVTLSPTGTIVLSGTNTYTGGTTIASGTIGIASNDAFGTNDVVISGAATLAPQGAIPTVRTLANNFAINAATTVNGTGGTAGPPYGFSGNILELNGNLTGAGNLQVVGGAALTLGGSNGAYAGNLIIGDGLPTNGGRVRLASVDALGTGTITLNRVSVLSNFTGATLTIDNNIFVDGNGFEFAAVNGATAADNIIINGSITGFGVGSFNKLGDIAVTLNGNNNYNQLYIDGGSVTAGTSTALGNGQVINTEFGGSATIAAGADNLGFANSIFSLKALVLDTANFTTTINGNLNNNGAHGVTKSGAGTLILNGVNGFAGGLAVNGGTVVAGTDTALGAGAVSFAAGTTLRSGAAVSLANNISVTGGVTIDTPQQLALNGMISGSGGITKTGSNALALAGNNSFTDGFSFTAGQINLGNSTGFGDAGNLVSVAVGTFGVTLANGLDVANNFTLAGVTAFTVGGGSTAQLSGVINGAGSINKTDTGTLILAGNNSYAGGTSVVGTLQLNNDTAAGAAAITLNGATLSAQPGINLTLANAVILNGGGSIGGGGFNATLDGIVSGTGGLTANPGAVVVLNNAGNTFEGGLAINGTTVVVASNGALGAAAGGVTITDGNLTLTGSFTNDRSITLGGANGTIDVNTGVTFTANGLISGSQLVKAGDGTLIIGNGGNVYTGGTSITAGTVAVAASNALGSGQVDLINGTFASVGAGVVTLANAVNIAAAGNFITIADAANTLELNGVVSGTDGFTKTGDGILRLNGANSYSGTIALNNGEIDLEGSIAGGINAAAGTRVTGSGTASGTTVIADGGILSPGNSPGVLAFGSLALSNAAILNFELAGLAGTPGVDADLITVTNDLTLDGILNITGLPGFNVGVGNRTIMTYGNLLADNELVIATAAPVDVAYSILAGPVGVGAGIVQVNVAFGGTYRWDGANLVPNNVIDGGAGTFNLVNTNFTNSDGSFNLAYGNNATDDIEFGGAAGSVDVMSAVNFDQMSFVTTGYTLGGVGSFNASNSAINLGANDATILTAITGGALAKNGTGALTLAGNNSYTSLAMNAGTLVAGSDMALGTAAASFGAATTLVAQGNRALGNDIVLAGGITVDAATNELTLGGAISGAGPVAIVSSGGIAGVRDGRVVLNGGNSYTGGTTATDTALTIGADAALGNATAALALNNSELRTTASFTMTRDIALGGTSAPTFNTDAATTLTANGVVSGGQLLQKIGGGTLVLGNAGNSFAGGIDIQAGTVAGGSDGALGAGNIRFSAAGGTLETLGNFTSAKTVTLDAAAIFNTNANANVFNGVFAGGGALIKNGSGNLVLNGANLYTGGTLLNAGTITVGNATALGSNPLIMADATTLAAGIDALALANATTTQGVGTIDTGAFTFTLGGVIDGAGSITKTGAGNLVLNGANAYANGTALNAGTVTVGTSTALGAGALVMADATTLAAGTDGLVLANAITTQGVGTVDTAAFSITLNGVIDGAGAITKNGAGTLVLNGANSYVGGSNINGGTVTAGSDTAFGAGLVTMAGGTTLANNTDNLVLANAFNIGNVVVATGSNMFTLAGTVDGAGLMTKTGSGNLVLNGTNDYTGGTALTAGTVTVGTGTALGTGQLAMSDATFLVAGADAITLANGVTTLGVGTVNTNASTLTLNGVVDGAGSIVKTGSGNLVLNNANSYSGGSTIAAGTVTVGNNTALGTSFVTMADGTTLANNANNLVVANAFSIGAVTVATGANTFTMTGAINGNGPLTKTGAGTLVLTGTSGYTGGTLLTAGTLQIDDGNAIGTGALTTTAGTTLVAGLAINTPTLTLANNIVLGAGGNTTINLLGSNYGVNVTTGVLSTNGTPLVLNGVISGDGGIDTLGFLANGGGSIAFNSTNSYTGGTNLGSVIALIGADGALGTGAVNLNAFGAGIQNSAAGTARTLANAINVNDFQHSVGGAGNLVLGGLIGGTSELFKVNDGTVTFNGVGSTYGGTFTVNDGTVLVNGSFVNAAANVAVAGGATIGGTGTIAGSVALADGANLNPGTSPGTLTVGNLSLSNLTNVNFELGAANTLGGLNDRVIVTGNLVLDGLLNVTETVGGTFGLGIYNLFSYGTLTDNGLTVNGALPNALTGSIQHNATAQQINLVIAGPDSVVLNWDGADFTGAVAGGQGGAGVWNAANTNWTGEAPGEINATWQPNAVGIFGVAGGTVDVGSGFSFAGLAFQAGGYTLADAGGSLTTNATTGSFISVDPALSATINATIAGTGVLMKQGTGTLVLGGTNTNSGGVQLMNGTLAVTSDAALGSGVLTFAGGTTLRTDSSVTIANNMVLVGTSTFDTLANAPTLNGVISGAGLLSKDGAGNLILTGVNTYSGGTNLNAGSLTIGNGAAIGTGTLATANATTVYAGLTAGGGSAITLANSVVLNGATTLNLQGTTGDVSLQGVLTLDGTTLTLNGPVSGAGSLLATGFGRVILNGNNSYGGGTTLTGVAAYAGSDTAFGSGTITADMAIIGNDSGALRTLANNIVLGVGGVTILGPNDLTLNGTVSGVGELTKRTTSTLTLTAANSYAGGTQLAGGTIEVGNSSALGTGTLFVESVGQATTLRAGAASLALANTVFLQAASNLVVDTQAFTLGLNGAVNGAGSLTKTGSGNLLLNVANSYSGGTTLNTGTITVGNNAALGTGALTAAGGTSLVAGSSGLNVGNSVTVNGGLTVDSGSGTFQLSGIVGGIGSLNKTNSGNLILSGVNSYAGGTSLNAGAITITNGASIGTGTLTAADGTALFNGLAAGAGAVTLANAVVLNGGLAIDLQGTVGSVNADGSLNSTGNALTLNGAVTGSGSLSAVGGAALFLNGANSYSGGTALNQVAAFAGTDTAFGTGNIAVTNAVIGNNTGATRTLANTISFGAGLGLGIVGSNDLVLNGVISGDGTLGKFGTQTLVLNGANSFTGGVGLLAGTIVVGNNAALGTGILDVTNLGFTTTLQAGANGLTIANAIDLDAPANLVVDTQAFTFTLGGEISSDGIITKTGTGNLILTGSNLYSGGTALTAGTITVTNNASIGTGQLTMSDATTLAAGAADVALANGITTLGVGTLDTGAFTFTLNGVLGGAGSIVKTGAGNLVLNAANSYAGTTTVTGGTVTVGNNAALSTGQVTMLNGTTLANNADNLVVANAFTIGNVTVATDLNTFTVGGIIDGAGLLTKTGSGNLVLNGANSYAGGTALTEGSITVGTSTALGSGQLTMSDATFLVAGADGLALANGITLLGAGTVNTQANIFTLDGVIGGAGSIVKTGSGNLVLNGANSYAGGTALTTGTITVGNNLALGTGQLTMSDATTLVAGIDGLVLANNMTTLGVGTIDTQAFIFTLDGVIGGAGSLVKVGSGNLVLNGANLFTGGSSLIAGTVTIGNNSALGVGTVNVDGAVTLLSGIDGLSIANNVVLNSGVTIDTAAFTTAYTGVISGVAGITKLGSGTLALTGDNSFAGGTALNVGTIQVGSNTALGVGGLLLGGGTTLQAGAADLALANTITTLGAGTIDTQAFTFTLNGVIDGAGSIVKVGSGNLVLNGANTFNGGSSLAAGTVTIGNNSALGAGTVSIDGAVTLLSGIDNLAIANDVVLNNGVTLDTAAFTTSYTGAISGAAGITKAGNGNLILSGVNSYAGGTNLNAGSLTVTNDSSIGTGALTTTGGTTLIVGAGTGVNTAITLANAVSLGAGTTTVNLQGTSIAFNNDGSIVTDGAALILNGVVSGDGALATGNFGSVILNGVNSYAGGTLINTRSVVYVGSDTAVGTGTVTMGGATGLYNNSGATRTLANSFVLNGGSWLGGSSDLVLNGGITGAGALIKAGAQTLALNGDNSGFTGNSQLRDGRITINTSTALGTGGTLTVFAPVVAPAAGLATTLAAGTDALALANNVVLSAGSNLIVESGAGSFTLNGVISGDGALTKIQGGTLVLNGASSFTGGTALNVGSIQVGNTSAIGTGGLVMADSTTLQAGVADLLVANAITTNGLGSIDTQGFTFSLNGVVDGAGSIAKIGAGNLVLNSANSFAGGSFINAGTVTVGSNTALGGGPVFMLDSTTLATNAEGLALANAFNIGNVTVATGAFTLTLNGPIGCSGQLTKTGTGNLALNGSNAYGGGTALTAGTITVGANTALGTGQLTMSDGTFLVAGANGLSVSNGITTLGVGTVNTGANTLTLAGIIGGAGSITKIGGGNLTLQGLNSYAGGTALNAGTMTVATDSAVGTGTLAIAAGTTLNTATNVGRAVNSENVVLSNAITLAGTSAINTGDALTLILTGPISGAGGFSKTGSGLLVLNGDNSFTGNLLSGVFLQSGTLRTGSNTALGLATMLTSNNSTLQNGVEGVTLGNAIGMFGGLTIDTQEFGYTLNGNLFGDGPVTKIGSANLTLNGMTSSYTGGTLLTAGSITVGSNRAISSGALTMSGGTSLVAGANDLALANAIIMLGVGTVNTNANLLTLAGVISGDGSLSKIGTGNLVLNGLNSYAGGTTLNSGTITVATDSALGTGALAMAGGTTLNVARNVGRADNSENVVVGNAITLAGVGTFNTGEALTLIATGVISGEGSLAKTGAGLLVLNGDNSYSGGTAFNAGTVRVGSSTAFGTGAVAAATGTILQTGVSGVALANNFVLAGGMTVDNFGNLLTLGGVLSGTGPLSVIDSTSSAGGVLTLAGLNSYTGGTVVTGTTLSVSQNANLGNVAGGVTLIGGTLRTTASFATDRSIVLGEGGGTLAVATGTVLTVNGVISGTRLTKNSGELVLNAANTHTGGTSLNAGTITLANNRALGTGALDMAGGTTLNTAANLGTATNTQNVTLANAITTAGVGTVNTNTGLTLILILDGTISGAGSLNKTGAGQLVINNQNVYAGGTTLAAGTIRTGNGSALGTGRLTTTGGTTLQAGNAGLTVANAITLGTGITTIDSQAFGYTLSGVASGAGGISKVGTGVLNLAGASTYTGATTVAAGTLNVTGALASAVTVNSGAALTGTGTVGALNVMAGGSVNPATNGTTGSATLAVTGAATLAGTYTVNVTPSASDRITAGGALTLGGTLAVLPTAPSSFTQFNQSFTVASGASRTGTFGTVTGLDQMGIAFAPVVEYTATQANLRLAPQSLVVLGNRFGGISGNELEVAQAFDRAVAAGYNPQAFFNVYANTGSNLPTTLRQMSGEQRATERRVVLDSNRVIRESALDRLNGGLASLGGQQVSTSDGDRTLTFWLRGAGSWGKGQTSGAATCDYP